MSGIRWAVQFESASGPYKNDDASIRYFDTAEEAVEFADERADEPYFIIPEKAPLPGPVKMFARLDSDGYMAFEYPEGRTFNGRPDGPTYEIRIEFVRLVKR